MNLSEKLAAADGAVDVAEATAPGTASGRSPRGPPERRRRPEGRLGEGTPRCGGPPTARPARRGVEAVQGRRSRPRSWPRSRPTAADLSPDELRDKVRSTVNEILEREDIGISPIERQRFVEEMLEDSLGYGPLEALLADGSITESHVQHVRRDLDRAQGQASSAATSSSTRRTSTGASSTGWCTGWAAGSTSPRRWWTPGWPTAPGSTPSCRRSRCTGPVLTIRKFPERALVMQDLIGLGSLTMDSAVFLEALVRGKISMIVVGGTGTGKTTMLNVLSNFIPDGERLITIEESAELQIQGAHVVTLETRPANAEGSGEVRIRDLVRNSLRMRPDRIIVGECRGSETLDMLQAMNTGHAGSMTTVHANTPRELLGRLETMVMMGGVELPQRAIREQIVMAVGFLVQLQRTPAGPRVVHSITEIQGMEGDTVLLQDIFHRVDMHEGMGRLVPTGLRPKILDELALNGVEVPPHLFRNDGDPSLLSSRTERAPPPSGPAGPGRRTAVRGALRDARAPSRREVTPTMLGALQLGSQSEALLAAVLVGAGLALAVVAMIMRVRTKQRTLAQILDDTMGTAEVPVEVVSESPEHGELSALTVRIAGIFGRIDTSRRPRAAPGAGGDPVAVGRVPRHQLRPSRSCWPSWSAS